MQCVLAAKTHQRERSSHLTAQAELTAWLEVATRKQAPAIQLQHSQGEPLGLPAGRLCCGSGQVCITLRHSRLTGVTAMAS